jgi:hypothetical protein
MLLNLMDACFRSSLMPRLREQEIGVLGTKTFGGADGIILKSKTFERSNVFIIRSIFQTSVVITGIDKRVEASKRHRDAIEIYFVILDLALRAAGTEIPLLLKQRPQCVGLIL